MAENKGADITATIDRYVKSENLEVIGELTGGIAHDINTPLTAIKGWTETLLCINASEDEMVNNGLRVIQNETERLYTLVEDLLDFSRMESGRMTLHLQKIDIVAELENRIEIDENEVNKICDLLEPSLNYKYPFSAHANIPAKVSVSKLYPELLNETDDYADIIKKAESLETKRPRFMGEESDAAERGTATHLFMQFCEISRLEANRTSIKEEISRLVAKKFIPQKVADLIRVEEIVKFVASDFYQSILKAKKLYREFRFNIFLPAVDFTNDMGKKEDLAEDEILVQGVIDLCFIDDNDKLILCDYKTDRIPREINNDREATTSYLEDRHAEQLKYYAKAIERIMGKSPDQILIYSLSFGDALEINV